MVLKHTLLLSLPLLLLVACRSETSAPLQADVGAHGDEGAGSPAPASSDSPAPAGAGEALSQATFAGGCFWCMETPFEKLEGVSAVLSGYTGGHQPDPTYEGVCRGTTGHAEAVQITFDPAVISYADLLEVFWRQIDPTDAGGQFVDRGTQYRSEIYYHDEDQKRAAQASKEALAASGRFNEEIVTPITAGTTWYPAEEYHQDFYKKKPERYHSYRRGSGRDRFLERTWGADRAYEPVGPTVLSTRGAGNRIGPRPWTAFEKPGDDALRRRLSALQYRVTQEEGTERAFQNEYWDNQRAGIYVDVVSGEPLFSSHDKYKSGTGWPSFTRPLVDEHLTRQTDYHIGYARTEVRSKYADSHLGHVFQDGPAPTGLRYCINSASLRFVPAGELQESGYGEFAQAFEGTRE